MEIKNCNSEKLYLEYQNGKPIMRMESCGVRMEFHFIETPPTMNARQVVVDILTSEYSSKFPV